MDNLNYIYKYNEDISKINFMAVEKLTLIATKSIYGKHTVDDNDYFMFLPEKRELLIDNRSCVGTTVSDIFMGFMMYYFKDIPYEADLEEELKKYPDELK